MERLAYYQRRSDAVVRPNSILSLIIDGMDQSKLSLPHYKGWNNPKVGDDMFNVTLSLFKQRYTELFRVVS
jgi:hypothetical protein